MPRMSLVGISYGGFVGYSMAAQFPEAVERVVLCCAGVCLEEKDMEDGLFKVPDLDEAASILLPQKPEKLRQLISLSFVKQARFMPSWFLSDFINVRLFTFLFHVMLCIVSTCLGNGILGRFMENFEGWLIGLSY